MLKPIKNAAQSEIECSTIADKDASSYSIRSINAFKTYLTTLIVPGLPSKADQKKMSANQTFAQQRRTMAPITGGRRPFTRNSEMFGFRNESMIKAVTYAVIGTLIFTAIVVYFLMPNFLNFKSKVDSLENDMHSELNMVDGKLKTLQTKLSAAEEKLQENELKLQEALDDLNNLNTSLIETGTNTHRNMTDLSQNHNKLLLALNQVNQSVEILSNVTTNNITEILHQHYLLTKALNQVNESTFMLGQMAYENLSVQDQKLLMQGEKINVMDEKLQHYSTVLETVGQIKQSVESWAQISSGRNKLKPPYIITVLTITLVAVLYLLK